MAKTIDVRTIVEAFEHLVNNPRAKIGPTFPLLTTSQQARLRDMYADPYWILVFKKKES